METIDSSLLSSVEDSSIVAGRLVVHAALFDSLVSLIPPRFYLPVPEPSSGSRFIHNKKGKAPKQDIKEATVKARKVKLDPLAFKSVIDLQAEDAQMKADGKTTQEVSTTFEPMSAPASVVELKQKLHDKIAQLAARRQGLKTCVNSDSLETEKPKSRQEILEKRRAKKAERKKKNAAAVQGKSRDILMAGLPIQPSSSSKKDSLTFGPIEFAEKSTQEILKTGLESRGSKKRKGPTDVKGQLQQALVKKKKLENLKEKDVEKASTIVESQKWSKVEALAAGDKIKDDIALLKKSVKKKEAIKKKSAAVWEKRLETVKKQGLDRQKKREENLQARKDAKKAGKKGGKKSVKGKKARPGFEGGKKKVKSFKK